MASETNLSDLIAHCKKHLYTKQYWAMQRAYRAELKRSYKRSWHSNMGLRGHALSLIGDIRNKGKAYYLHQKRDVDYIKQISLLP